MWPKSCLSNVDFEVGCPALAKGLRMREIAKVFEQLRQPPSQDVVRLLTTTSGFLPVKLQITCCLRPLGGTVGASLELRWPRERRKITADAATPANVSIGSRMTSLRRRFRFGLKSLFIAMTGMCV